MSNKSSAQKAISKELRSPRRLKLGKYQSFKLQKKVKHPVKLPSIYKITKSAVNLVWQNKGLFIIITIIYGLLNLLLVQGIAGSADTSTLKESLDEVFSGQFASVASSVSVFAILVGSAGNASNQTAGAYQVFLALITSLALIWSLRQLTANKKIRARDAFYKGIYPLVPFILVLLVVALQLIPLMIGSSLYSLVVANGIAVLAIEKLIWGIIYLLLALLTFYMLSSSLFALYIVTLPDMTPMKALRSSRELVRYRRLTVLRKILGLPIIMLVAAGIVMLPIIMWLTPLAEWVFFALTMLSLLAIHAYMYTLYRELLND